MYIEVRSGDKFEGQNERDERSKELVSGKCKNKEVKRDKEK